MSRLNWTCTYYHKASKSGIGFDRTTSGSNANGQYYTPLKEIYNNSVTCRDIYLLWFHHLPWSYRMKNGKNLWNKLCHRYDRGVQQVRNFSKSGVRWKSISTGNVSWMFNINSKYSHTMRLV
ncbi:hypothetical protein D0T87_21975 [Bacteroides sp. 51]|nr:hypothetical protein [Bacteroides sp. 51]